MPPSSYVPLWVKSNGSFLEGASHPEEIVTRAEELGLPALAITDRDSLNGVVRAHVKAREFEGLRVIVGAQVTVGKGATTKGAVRTAGVSGASVSNAAVAGRGAAQEQVVLLAQDRAGYGRLCRLISRGQHRCPKGQSRVTPAELALHAQGLIALATTPEALAWCADAFEGRLYAMIARHRRAAELEQERLLRRAALRWDVGCVAAVEVLYHHPSRRFLGDVLCAIRHGVTLDEAGSRLRENAEYFLASPTRMALLYQDLEVALARTHEVAARCQFGLNDLRYRYPIEALPEGRTAQQWLCELAEEGASQRYSEGVPEAVRTQLAHELALVQELDYGGYFLTMWDVVRFCQTQNILCQGRGSAANSVLCYCLGITAIDPIRMDLLFERFLSRERAEPPDIDLDIEHERREEVIQYVYRRWGRRRAAMVANVVRYRSKSALRDIGKVLSLPQTALNQASRLMSSWGASLSPAVLVQAGLDPDAPRVRLLMRLVEEIENFPRHLSIHPGGFLLGAEPVDTLVPVEPATMENRTVIQWDKQDVEDLGLFKVDLLGLGMLSQIHRCFDLIESHHGRHLTIATLPAEDPKTYAMISRADTVGVFQIESRAQMSMLPRLKPRTFYDLVIQVAIVRPGPIQGDMVHPYLRRRNGLEVTSYPHPSVKRILQKTLGVPIFQEQVMKLAVQTAGYSPGEADQLRRDMAAWRSRGRIEEHRERLVSRMIARGLPEDFADRVFSQIRGFGEYGFPESHAASFALLSYVTAWLKCHYHPEFTCALLNAWPMGFYQPSTLVEDAKRHAVQVLPIDVLKSVWECRLESSTEGPHPWAIRMGLRYVQGLGKREAEAFLRAPPPYRDLEDFARRTRLGKRPLLALAKAGALDCFGVDRRRALWAVRGLLAFDRKGLSLAPSSRPQDLPAFASLDTTSEVLWDYRHSAHSTRGHPMAQFRSALEARRVLTARRLHEQRADAKVTYVGMVICRQRPRTATGVTFMTLEDETGTINVIVWRPIYERDEVVAKTARILEVRGRLQREHGVVNLIAESLSHPVLPTVSTLRSGAVTPRSRDFH